MTKEQDKLNNYYLFTQATETFERLVKAKSEEEAERLFYAYIEENWGEGMANACHAAACCELYYEEALNFKGYSEQPVEWLERDMEVQDETTTR